MDAKQKIIVVGFLCSISCLAIAGEEIDYPNKFINESGVQVMPKAREEVRNEFKAAAKEPAATGDDISYPSARLLMHEKLQSDTEVKQAAKSREDVHNEAIAAVKNHRFDPLYDVGA